MANNDFMIPELPSLSQLRPDFYGSAGLMSTLRSIGDLPTLSGSALPEIRNLMSQRSEFLVPQIQAIREQTGQMVAGQQSDALSRGLTGSDIEAAGMLGARTAGLQQEQQMRGAFALQSSQMLADLIFRARQGDIEAQTQLRAMLAQAQGQEFSALRDINLFREQMERSDQALSRLGKTSLWASGITAAGAIAGGAAAG